MGTDLIGAGVGIIIASLGLLAAGFLSARGTHRRDGWHQVTSPDVVPPVHSPVRDPEPTPVQAVIPPTETPNPPVTWTVREIRQRIRSGVYTWEPNAIITYWLQQPTEAERWPELMHGHGFSDGTGSFAAICEDVTS